MLSIPRLTLAIFVLLAISTMLASAEEAKLIEESDIPDTVLKAFQMSFPDAKVTGYDIEVVDGVTQYEIETRVDKFEKDYVYLEDGSLLQTEEEIPLKSLPESVVNAVNKAHPNCEIDEAEKITRGETIEYEVVVEVAEEEFELLLSSEGQILASKEADEDEGEDDDEDDEKEDEE